MDASVLGLCPTDASSGGAGGGAGAGGMMAAGGSSGSAGMGTGGAGASSGGAMGSGGIMGSGGASASLTGTVAASMAAVDISAGTTDWAHWTNTQVNAPKVVKAGGPARISNYAIVGAGLTAQQYTDDKRTVSWSGGTPVASGSDTKGVYVPNGTTATGFGFSYSITGFGLAPETVDVYSTVFSGVGRLTATISDGSSPPLALTTVATGQNTPVPQHFQIHVSAASPSAILSISWVVSTNAGGFGANVTMVAVSISGAGGGTGTGGSAGAGGAGGAASGGAVGTGGAATGGASSGGAVGSGGAASGGATGTGGTFSAFTPEPMETFGGPAAIFLRAPIQGMTFLAPGNIPMTADSRDSSAPTLVEFLSNGVVVATLTPNTGTSADYFMRAVLKNLPTGTYNLSVRETSQGGAVHTSPTVTVSVVDPPAYSSTLGPLMADLVLPTGDVSFVGSVASPMLILANGHRIVSPAGWSGHLVMQNVHVRDAGADPSGDPTFGALGMDVTTTGGIDIEGSLFEHSGEVRLLANGTAPVTVRGNTWNGNTAISITNITYSQSNEAPNAGTPVVHFEGNSTGPKVFAGNRVAGTWVEFVNTNGWVFGGPTDGDSNVLVGLRAGIYAHAVGGFLYQGNYTRLLCPNRWTQCTNILMEFSGPGNVIEHSLINGGWLIRPFKGEVRYNVLNFGGEAYMQSLESGTKIHHNVIANLGFIAPGFCNNIFDTYDASVTGLEIYSNTWDGGGAAAGMFQSPVRVRGNDILVSLRSNVFANFPYRVAPVTTGPFNMEAIAPAFAYADYNAFFNPTKMTPSPVNYFATSSVGTMPGTPGFGGHDVGGFNADNLSTDPKFVGSSDPTLPGTAGLYAFSQWEVWARTRTVSEMLRYFADYYRPGASSPLIGAGDPADGAGSNVGAIGGTSQFESFGN